MTFYEHCQVVGIQLLKDDIKHIRSITSNLPYDRRKSVLRGYIDNWVSAMGECDCAAQKQNMGRRAANLYLLGVLNEKRNREMV